MQPRVMVPGPRDADGVQPLDVARLPGESALAFGRRVIAALLTPNLANVRRVFDATEGTPRFDFPQLIDRLYWELADQLTAGDLRQCPCGALFFTKDARQRVCLPVPPRHESACPTPRVLSRGVGSAPPVALFGKAARPSSNGQTGERRQPSTRTTAATVRTTGGSENHAEK